jgi:hypothetical protein
MGLPHGGREGASPTPVLVVRTPYNKDHMVAGGDIFNILRDEHHRTVNT